MGFLEAVNSCDASKVIDYYLSCMDFESYFANPNRRRRMNYGYINSEYDTKEEWLSLIREIWDLHNMVFKEFEYKIMRPWILSEENKVTVPTLFEVRRPFQLKYDIAVTWFFMIQDGLLFSSGYFGDPLAVLSNTGKHFIPGMKPSKHDISEYIVLLKQKGLIRQ